VVNAGSVVVRWPGASFGEMTDQLKIASGKLRCSGAKYQPRNRHTIDSSRDKPHPKSTRPLIINARFVLQWHRADPLRPMQRAVMRGVLD